MNHDMKLGTVKISLLASDGAGVKVEGFDENNEPLGCMETAMGLSQDSMIGAIMAVIDCMREQGYDALVPTGLDE